MPRIATAEDEAFETARLVLDRLMTERSVTEVELGAALGLAQSTVSDKRRGRSNLNLSDIRRAALFFGVTPAEFFGSPLPGSPAANAETAIAA
jgi:transcriptional regulator with XRE-family HTH domain